MNSDNQTSFESVAALGMAGASLLGGALYYLMNNQTVSDKAVKLIDYANQTRELEGRTDGARVCTLNTKNEFLTHYYEDGKTLYELLLKAEKISNNGSYLGSKKSPSEPYKYIKYSEAIELGQQIGSGIIDCGIEPGKEKHVGIFAKNRAEWVLTDVACMTYSFVNVPLYDTLGIEAVSFILLQTQLKLVVCDDSAKAMQLMNVKSQVEYIVVIEEISDEVRAKAAESNIKVKSFEELIEMGKKNLKAPVPPKPEDLTTICYTSGTTGMPKGAMITHENMVSTAASMVSYVKSVTKPEDSEQERYLSYLPLAHMFERVAQATVVSIGGSIGFFQGDIKKLSEDLKEVKPTIFCVVPRLLNRIYSKVVNNLEASPAIKQMIFNFAFRQKEKEVMRGIIRNDSIYDLLFKPVRESLGGSVKFMITGSAPISTDVLHFLRVVSGCHVLEGYGATETSGATCVQVPGETTVGHVGPPFMCCMYKLIDVPEMGLEVKRDNKGEILIAGKNVFKGYYKDDEKTKDALDSDGWYHTGDIGVYDKNGCLKIVDRVKNIFKLQQGEYIAPEKIENLYVRSKYVAQVFVYGDSLKSHLIAVATVEEVIVKKWAEENNVEYTDLKSLCKNKELIKVVLSDLTQIGKASGLKGFEQVRELYLHDDLFSVENGLLTPTMKSKRNELKKHFHEQITEMYKNLD